MKFSVYIPDEQWVEFARTFPRDEDMPSPSTIFQMAVEEWTDDRRKEKVQK